MDGECGCRQRYALLAQTGDWIGVVWCDVMWRSWESACCMDTRGIGGVEALRKSYGGRYSCAYVYVYGWDRLGEARCECVRCDVVLVISILRLPSALVSQPWSSSSRHPGNDSSTH